VLCGDREQSSPTFHQNRRQTKNEPSGVPLAHSYLCPSEDIPWSVDQLTQQARAPDLLHHPLPLSHTGCIREHASCPAVDVELLDKSTHAPHPSTLLYLGHGQSDVERGGKLIDVVRVDHERLSQFTGSSRELTEDQDALLVIAGADEFFGDQIHPVVETADHTDIRAAITLTDLGRLVMLNFQTDRFVAIPPEPLVDLLCQCKHLAREVLVLFDDRAAGSGNLNECELADPFGLEFQQPFHRH